jgi:Family of unknown function (DUF6056)
MKQWINSKLYLWLSLGFVFALFFTISYLSPLAGDDWGYAVNGLSQNPFVLAYEFYFSWSGRFFSELYGFLVTPHKFIWNILNPLLFVSILYNIVKLTEIKKMGSFLLLLFLILSVKDELRMETYTWLMGTTYVIPLALSLYVFRIISVQLKEKHLFSKLHIITLSISVFIIGLMMENIAAIMVFALLVLSIYAYFVYKPFAKNLIILFIISVLALTLLRLSPGASFRLLRDNAEWMDLSLLEQLIHNYPNFIQMTFIDHRYLVLALSTVLAIYSVISHQRIMTKIISTVVFSIASVISVSLTIQSITKLNLSYFTEANSIFNLIYWPFFIFFVYISLFKLKNDVVKEKLIFFVTLAGLSNGIMMLSPIFGYRSSIYTVYFLIIVVVLLYDNFKLTKGLSPIINVLLILLIAKTTQTYLYKYTLANRTHQLRLAEIAYYQDHPEVKEVWLIRYPIYTLHSGDIEKEDSYHMDVFKTYYDLSDDQTLIFYFPEIAYEDYLSQSGY